MALHEIAGPILASVAVMLAVYVFKRTLDYQAYKDIDSNYMEILKIGVSVPHVRDPQWINTHYKEGPIDDKEEEQKRVQYDQYAYLAWNICETLYDRKKVDETWAPVIQAEKDLHFQWIQRDENKRKFKKPFLNYINNYHYDPNAPPSMRKAFMSNTRDAKPFIIVGAIIVILVTAYLIFPALLGRIEYFDSRIALECAHDIKAFNVSHAYDCSKFSPGSLAQLCIDDYKAFSLKNIKGCSKFLSPGKIVN